jgi:hypothetical protein
MPQCQKCSSDRILTASAKCSDRCSAAFGDAEQESGYVPEGVGIDDGEDYIYFKVCLECGQMQGEWPKPDPKL